MKKYTLLALMLLLVLMLTACSSKPTEPEATEVPTPEPTVYIDPNLMTIRPAEFSEETQQVLDILNTNLTFFDYTVDESIRSMNLEMWNLSDAGWTSTGRTLGNIDSTEGRIGISLTGATYDLYIIDEGDTHKVSYDALSGFEAQPSILGSRLSESSPIVSDQEVELWMRLGAGCTNNSFASLADFRSADCQTGLAVTVTFSVKTAEEIIAEEEAAAAAALAAAEAAANASAAPAEATEEVAEQVSEEVSAEAEVAADAATEAPAETIIEETVTLAPELMEAMADETKVDPSMQPVVEDVATEAPAA